MTNDLIVRDFIDNNPSLCVLASLITAGTCWLVGGSIRDLLLGRDPGDIDLVCDFDPTSLAKNWSRSINGRWFWLDADRAQSRVLSPEGVIYDFAPLRAETIHADLELRDYTINAIAYPLEPLLGGQSSGLIDPLDGVKDLQHKVLRQCHDLSFSQDPLRMLKGIRHAVFLDFTFSRMTLLSIAEKGAMLHAVAGERIRDELNKMLSAPGCIKGVQLLLDTGLLEIVFSVRLSDDEKQSIVVAMTRYVDYLNGRPLIATAAKFTMVLARLIELCRVSSIDTLTRDTLRLSRREQDMISRLQVSRDSADRLSGYSRQFSVRQNALFYETFHPFALEKLLRLNFESERIAYEDICQLADDFSACSKGGKVPDLVAGNEIIGFISSSSGKTVGDWLRAIKAAEITGEIKTRDDAVEWLKQQNSD